MGYPYCLEPYVSLVLVPNDGVVVIFVRLTHPIPEPLVTPVQNLHLDDELLTQW